MGSFVRLNRTGSKRFPDTRRYRDYLIDRHLAAKVKVLQTV